MSESPARRYTLKVPAVLAVVTGLLLAAAVPTRADDFDRFRAQQEVAAQKMFEEVKSTLVEARRLERTNPAEATRLLKKCLASVEDDASLSEPQRAALQRQLRTRLREVDDAARARQESDAQAARVAAEKRQREQRRADQERPADPNNSASKAKDLFDAAKNRVADAAKIKSSKEAGVRATFRDNEESAIASDKPMTFASSYAYRAALRGKQQLTDKEKALLKALNSVMSVDFNKSAFRDVIDYMIEKTGQPIMLDQESLKEAMVEYDDPVTFKAKKVTVRTILKKVLADRGLTYILQEGTIQVVTPQKARDTLVARSYPIGDLASSLDMRFPPLLRRLQMLQTVSQLIDLIQNSVEPSTWQINGGAGTIAFYEPSQSLVIRQTAEMHYQLGGALGR
jgi:hypothetical protein